MWYVVVRVVGGIEGAAAQGPGPGPCKVYVFVYLGILLYTSVYILGFLG